MRALPTALLLLLACETEADRREERLDRLARTIRSRLAAADLPAVPHGEPWVAGEVRVVVGEGIDVDRTANALELYRAEPKAYAESRRPIPGPGTRAVPLSSGRPPEGARSDQGTLPALSEALRPPPPTGQMGAGPSTPSVPENRGPVDLAIGAQVPYATFTEVLLTVTRASYSPRLLVRLPGEMGQLPVRFPPVVGSCWSTSCIEALSERRSIPEPTEPDAEAPPARLELTLAIDERGVDLFGSGGALARGCEEVRPAGDPGPTVPRRDGSLDGRAIEVCLSAIDELFPDADVVWIQPEAATPFGEVALVASLAFGEDRFPLVRFTESE